MNLNTFSTGSKLGMWNPFSNIRSQEDYNKLPDDLKKTFGEILGYRGITSGLNESPEERKQKLQVELDAQKQMLEYAQGLGKESVREAFKYSTLANIPKTIAQSFGNIAATNLYAGQAVTDTFAKTLANYPRPQFSTYEFRPEKYFG